MTAAGAKGPEVAAVGSPAEAGQTGLAGEDLALVDPNPGHRASGPPVPVHASSVRNRLDRDQRDRDRWDPGRREHDQPGRGHGSLHLALGPRVLARLIRRRMAAPATFPMAPGSQAHPIAWRQTADRGARRPTGARGARPATARSSAVLEAAVQASHAQARRGPARAPRDRVAISPVATGSADDRSARVTSTPGAPPGP
jgi:hypothetical protein